MPFDESLRTKVLLWSDRHCCLCKQPGGVKIEVHHVVPESEGGANDVDNALPVCFNCHGDIHCYNPQHPRGTKFKPDEVKARRDQVYEEFTRHLVPPIHYEITQAVPGNGVRVFPDAGFVLRHAGDSLPVRVKVTVLAPYLGGARLAGYYGGEKLWHLNPRFSIWGHFTVPEQENLTPGHVRLEVQVSVIDQYERTHELLPVEYVYMQDGNYWYLEP